MTAPFSLTDSGLPREVFQQMADRIDLLPDRDLIFMVRSHRPLTKVVFIERDNTDEVLVYLK